MERHLVGEVSPGDGCHLQHIVQKLHHVHRLLGCFAFMSHDAWVEEAYVCRTTGRGSHNIVITPEELVVALHQIVGHVLKACITHRLAATGLLLGVLYIASQGPQQFICSYADVRIEGIDVAWYE